LIRQPAATIGRPAAVAKYSRRIESKPRTRVNWSKAPLAKATSAKSTAAKPKPAKSPPAKSTGRTGTSARRTRKKPAPSPAGVVSAQLRQPGAVLGPRANRTIALILDATRQIFLKRGYAGTTIDDIAGMAGVSRASFYTYFPSKRDVLLALGADTVGATAAVIQAAHDIPARWKVGDIEEWVRQCFALLDEHGAFAFAWTQAAHEDEEIRVAGTRGHLQLCRQMGLAFQALGLSKREDPVTLGLLILSMLERSWAYCQLYRGTMDEALVRRETARVLASIIRGQ
jgi:AcrR family transcriptional regulator